MIEVLRHDIATGVWPIGSRLPFEAELLDRLGVSRVTLRQAVQALVHVGVLETIQGSGTFVRASHELDAVLARFLSGEDLGFLLEARLAIEPEAAQLAAARATSQDLTSLVAVLAESRRAADQSDLEALTSLSAEFHRGVVLAARNPIMTHLYRAMETGTERTVREGSAHQTLAAFVDEHAAILQAIKNGDGEAAFTISRRHLAQVLVNQPHR